MADIETTRDDGSPIELYTITNNLGTWSITSCDVWVTYNGVEYNPISIKRTAVKQTEEIGNEGVTLTITAQNEIVRNFIMGNPQKATKVIIKRVHRRDSSVTVDDVFLGVIATVNFEGTTAQVKCLFGNGYMARKFPRVSYQPVCNHVIYSDRCGVNKANFATVANVSEISSTYFASSDITQEDGYFKYGFAEFASNTFGEQKVMIINHVGTKIYPLTPLRGIMTNMNVTLYAGCNRKSYLCKHRYNNLSNYLGWEYMPLRNPFGSGGVNDVDYLTD